MNQLLKAVLAAISELFFPVTCVGCAKIGSYLCSTCYSLIEFYPQAFVPPLELLYLENIKVCGSYRPPLKKLITTYKYGGIKEIHETIAELLWQSVNFPQTDLITYVPLHSQKLKKRGFNQTKLIAEVLAEKLNLPCLATLEKSHFHRSQASTTSNHERLINIKDTFTTSELFKKWLENHHPPPRSILVIDDVVTTGATLNEMAKKLKELGIEKVFGLVLAHGR